MVKSSAEPFSQHTMKPFTGEETCSRYRLANQGKTLQKKWHGYCDPLRRPLHKKKLQSWLRWCLPASVLQKPSANSKAKEHAELLIRRMQQCQNGDNSSLLEEGILIQQHLHYAQSRKPGADLEMDEDYVAGSFGKQVHAGNMRAALRLL